MSTQVGIGTIIVISDVVRFVQGVVVKTFRWQTLDRPLTFRLVDAANTHNPALVILRNMGFAIGIYEPTYDEGETRSEDDFGHYYARNDDCEFVAGDPLSLLGLVAIWQQRGEQWQREDDPFLITELSEEPWPD